MLKLPSLSDLDAALRVKLYLYTEPTDMRKGFDGLIALAQQVHQRDFWDGSLFLFLGRRRDRMKILYWDKDGPALWYKRLEAGTFRWPAPNRQSGVPEGSLCITASELAMLLDGIDLRRIKRAKRYVPLRPPTTASISAHTPPSPSPPSPPGNAGLGA